MRRLVVNEKIDVAAFKKPKIALKLFLSKILRHPAFDGFIICFIIGNVVVMAIDQDDTTVKYQSSLSTANLFFSGVFICEAIFKIFVLDFSVYIQNSWNK